MNLAWGSAPMVPEPFPRGAGDRPTEIRAIDGTALFSPCRRGTRDEHGFRNHCLVVATEQALVARSWCRE